ncbi:MAG: hypothetical protein M0R39_09370 [Prolixibacteraceae bacterium]|nr:hypothetical protein [Prolixibacteraceae bacterium]
MEIQKGDQFRAYLDPLKPFDYYYIDFSQGLGSDRFVKSMEEEDREDVEEEKMVFGKITELGVKLGLEEAEDDPAFWKKLLAFKKNRN